MFKAADPTCKAAVKDMFPTSVAQKAAFPGSEEDRFTMVEELGRGSFSIIFKVTDGKAPEGGPAELAIKAVELPKDDYLRSRLLRETEILKEINHPGCIKMYESFDTMPNVLHMTLELLPGGTLRRLLDKRGAMTESEAVPMARQLVATLNYLHSEAKIVHRDLKPENIMPSVPLPDLKEEALPEGIVWKLVDFGVACKGAKQAVAETAETLYLKINCSRCGSTLSLPPQLGDKRGFAKKEKVRCSNCGHIFFASFEQEKIKPIDISDAKEKLDEASMGGTAGYMAPELLEVDKMIQKGMTYTQRSLYTHRPFVCCTAMPL